MKNFLLTLTLVILGGCYAAHTVMQDYQLDEPASAQSIDDALALLGYSQCQGGKKNDYCFQNNSFPSFAVINKNGIVTIEMALTHISRKQETEIELSKIESALLKVKGVKKLCRHNETMWGVLQDANSNCPGS